MHGNRNSGYSNQRVENLRYQKKIQERVYDSAFLLWLKNPCGVHSHESGWIWADFNIFFKLTMPYYHAIIMALAGVIRVAVFLCLNIYAVSRKPNAAEKGVKPCTERNYGSRS